MTRPEDIPEDVWEIARETGEVVFDGAVDLYETVIETVSISLAIARALLLYGQRRAEEATERAARVAERMGAEFAVPERKVPLGDDPGDGYATIPATKARRLLFGSSIASVIRSSK